MKPMIPRVETKKIAVGPWYSAMKKKHPELFQSENVKEFVIKATAKGLNRELILSAAEVAFNCNRGTARDAWGRQVKRTAACGTKSKSVATKPKQTVSSFDEKSIVGEIAKYLSSLGGAIVTDSEVRSEFSLTLSEWMTIASNSRMVKYCVELHGRKFNGRYWGSESSISTLKQASAHA
jgi:hypothetical protein